MDVIIQLIIILVIISSVLKRFKEISKKGQKLDKEKIPGQILEMFDLEEPEEKAGQKPAQFPADQHKEPIDEYSEPVEISGERMEDTVVSIEEAYEPVEAPEITEEDIFDTQPEPLMPQEERVEASESITTEPVVLKPALHSHPVTFKNLDLGFTAPQVVNGIIMGEILGPPVAMKHNERGF